MGQLPHKKWSQPLWLAPHMMTLKSSLNLHAPPSPINMTTMIRQHKFPPSASPQANLFTSLFTVPQLTLDDFQWAASLTPR